MGLNLGMGLDWQLVGLFSFDLGLGLEQLGLGLGSGVGLSEGWNHWEALGKGARRWEGYLGFVGLQGTISEVSLCFEEADEVCYVGVKVFPVEGLIEKGR